LARPSADVCLFPMPSFTGVGGSTLLDSMHKAQRRHPIREVWDPALRLPARLVEYACAVCADFAPQIRQEAVLLLKRYRWKLNAQSGTLGRHSSPNLQVVALTCAHLAMKHWQRLGIPEQRLHWLSRNSYIRQDFIDTEVEVMQLLDCNVHWEGILLAEWVPLLLHLAGPLTSAAEDVGVISAVATHLADVLAFRDEIMAAHLPSELAAATVHAAALRGKLPNRGIKDMICTRRFQRYTLTLRVSHFCRTKEEQVVRLSEQILFASIGNRCAEILLEGSGVTAEDSDLEHDGNRMALADCW